MKTWGGLTVLLCAVAAVMPASTSAKPGYLVSPPHFSISATLPKSNGYVVYLTADHRWAQMILERHDEIAIYFVKGKADRNGIDADFGRFGHVHARFTGHRLEREPLFPGCRGRRRIEIHGRLDGSVRFRGERGFATVSSKRVRASFERGFKETCHFGPESKRDDRLIDVLEASGKTAGGAEIKLTGTYLGSIGTPSPLISASIFERIGRVTAIKSTISTEEGSILEFSPAGGRPHTVTMSPTPPFQGSASYAALPGGHSEWSGDLRVPFAGLGTVDLTGPSFHADACRIRLANQSLTCAQQQVKGRPRPSSLYGSGSHSQPLAVARLSSLR